jgi:putative Holliday junction resolvase
MRILGIDYGEKRIGLAITDKQNSMAMPFCMLENDDFISENILKIIKNNDVGKIVIGRPVNLKGQSGYQAEIVESFISNILRSYELPIFVFDERFTSKISSDLISESYNTPGKRRNKSQNKKMPKEGMSQARKSGALDTISAALILGDYLSFLKIQESKQKP